MFNIFRDVTVTEEFLLISFDRILQMIKSEDLCVEEEIVSLLFSIDSDYIIILL